MTASRAARTFVHYDPETDILFISGRKGFGDDTLEISPGVYLEVTDAGEVLSVQVWGASKQLKSFTNMVASGARKARWPAVVADRPRKS